MLLIGDFGKFDVNVLSRNVSEDYWDGNWLYANIVINVGFFTADFNCNLRTDEFDVFYKNLEDLLIEKNTTAQFSTMEEGLFLSFERIITGGFILKGEAKSNENYKTSLSFEISLDYTQMTKLKSAINDILKKYPVLGSPL